MDSSEFRVRKLEPSEAIEAFTALAQETRLAVFRLLIRQGMDGLKAGEIAKRLEVRPSTLSGHLHLLTRAGLLKSRRHQRHIIYSVDIDGTHQLLQFLTADCCNGHPEICKDLGRAVY